jgi:hypothetical protein
MKTQPPHLSKILVRLPAGSWHGFETETIWAEKVGEDQYRLRNVPFFAKGFAVGDVVATTVDHDGVRVVDRVTIQGGHSTYRMFLTNGTTMGSMRFKEAWDRLAALGCTYERATGHLVAVDVPPHADIQKVYVLLQQAENEGVWEFEEGHCGHC